MGSTSVQAQDSMSRILLKIEKVCIWTKTLDAKPKTTNDQERPHRVHISEERTLRRACARDLFVFLVNHTSNHQRLYQNKNSELTMFLA